MDLLLKLGVQHPASLRTGVEVVLCAVSLLVPWGMRAFARPPASRASSQLRGFPRWCDRAPAEAYPSMMEGRLPH